jgi:hypothetical protein
VMIGTSVLLLRGKSSRAPATAEVTVTEQGAPAPVATAAVTSTASPQELSTTMPMASAAAAAHALEPKPSAAPLPADEEQRLARTRPAFAKEKDNDGLNASNASAPGGAPNNLPPSPVAGGMPMAGPATGFAQPPAQAAQAQGDKKAELSPFDSALQSYKAGRFDDATRTFDGLAAGDPNADLWAARAVRESKGCRNALARFDKVARRASGSPPGWDALLEGALCYRAVGDFGQARVRLTELLKVDSHKDRAQAELDRMTQLQQAQGSQAPAAPAARPSPKRAVPAATGAAAVDQSAF